MNEPHGFGSSGPGRPGEAARTLRETGSGGVIMLLGDEPERPCERPPLSTGLLPGLADRASVFVYEAGW